MMKSFYILVGSITLVLGIIGILIPGLPTTPFLLISAWAFARGSERLHRWLIGHKIFGPYIKEYLEHRGLTRTTKIVAISLMTVMVTLSILFFIELLWVKILVSLAGIAGLIVIVRLPTVKIP
ncbi:MAG: YbaN family protein [Bacteroidales bacterium]